jgi:hypothetical protein
VAIIRLLRVTFRAVSSCSANLELSLAELKALNPQALAGPINRLMVGSLNNSPDYTCRPGSSDRDMKCPKF